MKKRAFLAVTCVLWASTAFAQHDAIDLRTVVYHASLNVSNWPITKVVTGVELKPGTREQGDVGVRLTLSPYNHNMHADSWPDFIMWPPAGDLRWTLWLFVKMNGVWHGAAVHEFWKDRVWTGAPLLTQYGDWIYPNPGSPWGEMGSYSPAAGDEVGFMATSGDLRLRKDVLTVNQRSNVVKVRLTPSANYTFGAARQTAGDFDGDGKSDQTVFRASNGFWYTILSRTGSPTYTMWGSGADIPVPADYDGDGLTDYAIFRPSTGTWHIIFSSSSFQLAVPWGNAADKLVPGDYDGDGRADIAVYRPSNGTWYIIYSSTWTTVAFTWGTSIDIPIPGDYDGDGRTDVAVFRPANVTFYVAYSSGGSFSLQWGLPTDIPLPGDYDGDGRTDIALFRPSTGVWYVGYATGAYSVVAWGNWQDIPVPGDYDGDGTTDIAVFRPSNGTWYWVTSSGGTFGVNWGESTDVPILKSLVQ
jgi:FG-GAP-like repeat